jgi:hypothetical protein
MLFYRIKPYISRYCSSPILLSLSLSSLVSSLRCICSYLSLSLPLSNLVSHRYALLGASLRLTAKATSSDPRQLGPWVHVVFVCTRLFYKWSNGGRVLQGSPSRVKVNERRQGVYRSHSRALRATSIETTTDRRPTRCRGHTSAAH